MPLSIELEKYHKMGLILIPMTVINGKKKPLIEYKGYKNKLQDLPTLQGLYESYKDVQPLHWAVYCINDFVGLDFDTAKDYETFFSDINTLTTRSPSGGYHAFLRSLTPCKSFNVLGIEVKVNVLCTISGEGYNIFKDAPIKEFDDAEVFLIKKFPKIKVNKKAKDIKIQDVITKFTELTPSNKDHILTGKCPLHGDTDEEHLYVYENTNSWYCFRCKKGGDAASFIMALKKLKYKDALTTIYELLGIEGSLDEEIETKQVSTLRLNNILYEQVLTHEGYRFVYLNETYKYLEIIRDALLDIDYVPCTDEEIVKGMVKISKEPIDYENLKTLLTDINSFIYKWLDISDKSQKFYSYYVLQTWVYENFHSIGYARALGDLGTGKTRFLDVIGGLCYKAMVLTGAVGAAPIFRIMDKHHGTLVIDEANFAQTDETAAILQIFNSGYEKGKPVIRMDKDDLSKINVFNTFCPKVFGTRKKFTDAALESRCYTEVLTQTSREDILALLSDAFFQELDILTQKLLDFRMKNINVIKPDDTLQADFSGIEMRLIQKALPLAAIVKTDPEAYKEFVEYIKASQEDLIEDRQGSWEGMVVCAIFSLYEEGLSTNTLENIIISGEDIAEKLNEGFPEKKKTNSQKVGKMLKTLGFSRKGKRVSSEKIETGKRCIFKRALDTDLKLLSKLVKRYTFLDDENYPKLKGLVSSVSSATERQKNVNNNNTALRNQKEQPKSYVKNPPCDSPLTLDTLDTLDTKIEKSGKLWQKQNQKSINSLTKTDFVFWFCKQNKNDGYNPSEIMPIVERIFKITPEGQQDKITQPGFQTNPEEKITIEVCGEISEVIEE